jgi:antitoxin VapB
MKHKSFTTAIKALEVIMKTAELFTDGKGQAVRLPEEFRFEGSEVFIRREGGKVVLLPKTKTWRSFFKDVPPVSEDFMNERIDFFQPEREDI